jgi:S-adenosylmethionine hydrolase
MQPSGIITLTTDFGLSDSYVGIMKGVILGIARSATIVDITHQIAPQDIHQAAYIVQTFGAFFPPGTIHVVVVDPGVGSKRRRIILTTPNAVYVAPDNGVLTYVWREAITQWGMERCAVYNLTEPRYWLPYVSSTFHGRDVFAPVAAHLVLGVPPAQLGERCAEIVEAALEQPSRGRHGELVGAHHSYRPFLATVLPNITLKHLQDAGIGERMTAQLIGQRIEGFVPDLRRCCDWRTGGH